MRVTVTLVYEDENRTSVRYVDTVGDTFTSVRIRREKLPYPFPRTISITLVIEGR